MSIMTYYPIHEENKTNMSPQAMPSPQSSSPNFSAQGPMANIRYLNKQLDEQASLGTASEDFLLSLLERLARRDHGQMRDYWPTLARLAELTLYSAGCLALAGEFAACGDLLINPDGKMLHIKDSPRPLALKRHQALTRQVAHLVPAGWHVIDWLKQCTILEVPQKALLPRLREELEGWPQAVTYLKLLDHDWKALASSLALLVDLDSRPPDGLPGALTRLPRSERLWLESRLYQPNLERFHELGRMIDGAGRGDYFFDSSYATNGIWPATKESSQESARS